MFQSITKNSARLFFWLVKHKERILGILRQGIGLRAFFDSRPISSNKNKPEIKTVKSTTTTKNKQNIAKPDKEK